MSKPKTITSDFAILDVRVGRKGLAKHFQKRPRLGPCPDDLLIPVTITGFIEAQHSADDGTSIEFSIDVTKVVLE